MPKVLIVDDEPTVLKFTRQVLERAGYEVLSAPGGDEALALCQQNKETISLVVTDVQMPGLDGRELARCLGRTHDKVPILFMTGYLLETDYQDDLTGDPRLDGHLMIRKPFRRDAFLNAVNKLLNGQD